ncbi:hypothetical protein [Candidatus Mycobacterium methanotrophicum]|uniref:Uncharacterized protein n=1 Tax=Candidatus Mycobacterium methanotrophicum TaxID=2943498 RepID=A0ABY4QN87_9MYCO|nr:hypothetical protein [Candidatus Mycobacterium methanotrophicum]UQX11415.1 hypothetical protein M5I08_02510 [Candidatus Mycobacterium methanotrophicum]
MLHPPCPKILHRTRTPLQRRPGQTPQAPPRPARSKLPRAEPTLSPARMYRYRSPAATTELIRYLAQLPRLE